MTEIKKNVDCGNSPKNGVLEDLAIAIARADASRIAAPVTSDIRWKSVGREVVLGIMALCKAITRYGPASVVTIEHVIAHGKAGAVNGAVEFGRKRRAFCLVVEFSNAKGSEVREITSYSVAL